MRSVRGWGLRAAALFFCFLLSSCSVLEMSPQDLMEALSPEAVSSGTVEHEAAPPVESVPEVSAPEESTPSESVPETSVPPESAPETSVPPESTPEESAPQLSSPPQGSALEEEPPGESAPEESSAPEEGPAFTLALEEPHSAYGRSTLSAQEQAAYDALAQGLLSLKEAIPLSLPGEAALQRVLLCVFRDYPSLFWVDSRYTYERTGDSITRVYPSYTDTPEEIAGTLSALHGASAELLSGIGPELSDFDRALLLHDRLCRHVEYDLGAPRQREAYGALCNGRATCEGYARAYAYLLAQTGIEALLVYGEAGEPHAWNILRLDGKYYLADPTWGDMTYEDGTVVLSHAYLFAQDSAFSSHRPYRDGQNYPLPACRSTEEGYFWQKGLSLKRADEESMGAALSEALDLALSEDCAVQIQFADSASARAGAALLQNGAADSLMQALAESRGFTVKGRSYLDDARVLTYLLDG